MYSERQFTTSSARLLDEAILIETLLARDVEFNKDIDTTFTSTRQNNFSANKVCDFERFLCDFKLFSHLSDILTTIS